MTELQASINQPAPHPSATTPVIFGSRLSALLFSLGVVTVLYSGWLNRDYHYLTAESGTGYALGIIGGVLMLILLLYPARKRFRFMRILGPVKYWFRGHMMLGIIGPTCILFHANFQLGSLNSNVALACMLLVASSGIIGRFIYRQIHYGLYGRKATLEQLRKDKEFSEGQLAETFRLLPRLQQRLAVYEGIALSPPRGLIHSVTRRFTLTPRSMWTRLLSLLQIRRALRQLVKQQQLSTHVYRQRFRLMKRYLSAYFSTIQKITVFSFYERLFSMWHVLHLPLFLMMLISGIAHVIAVHMY